ncbi:hypothetical protein SAMN05518849_101559 [Sphingobium sp. AP50]|uniref:hypothetical protein n=1 Tax=Sphingobium sp. AP50 TaxID=1884369 RepID=UPI0008BE9A1E|nr:hypothetical protein [Sphingobium sp. AP50]SEI68748.1 hypothetical protein SAMN05518849_101559 [Sphingobium sp. AP50]
MTIQTGMNAVDVAALSQMAQGDGEMHLSKRLVRALLAQMALADTIHRTQAMVDRNRRRIAR